jgi:hypothetical protein
MLPTPKPNVQSGPGTSLALTRAATTAPKIHLCANMTQFRFRVMFCHKYFGASMCRIATAIGIVCASL